MVLLWADKINLRKIIRQVAQIVNSLLTEFALINKGSNELLFVKLNPDINEAKKHTGQKK